MNKLPIETREVFYSIRVALKQAQDFGQIIPDTVFTIIDNLELEHEQSFERANRN